MSILSASRPARLSRDAQRLVFLAQALELSGSRIEDIYWEKLLLTHLDKLLRGRQNRTVETALEHLLSANSSAYEVLAEQAETASESLALTRSGVEYDVLLVSAPVLAWTRYQLPSVALNPSQQEALVAHLREHVVSADAKVAIVPYMIGFEQMPQSFHDTWAWTDRLGRQALGMSVEPHPAQRNPENDSMLADTQFLIAAVVVPKGEPVFRWQTSPDSIGPTRETCHKLWQQAAGEVLAPLYTACQTELLLPDAFYMTNREADRRIRPLSIMASVAWLQIATPFTAHQLRACIAACGNENVEEYRIGFSPLNSNDVIYGCIWPVLSREEAMADSIDSDQPSVSDEIAALLKQLDIHEIKRLPGILPSEFCEDCGAPYFPNALGEMLHPELPEDADTGPVQFH
ncbi:DUF2863 family protein [Paracandidimonas soli]|uniref:Uncharacterized protein DUF2863 n=1 Tax=Paracandidimonas soli TaxID=1917182 RepID=A0A4V2VS75_9BURK|nr:DUF2863 family protein [Paracandidimonas soli]TCV01330.1 uncharacterized protein DUF2863 [Paracandidimonas soli]